MSDFVVSARKYRPKGFEEVVGQSHITTTLEHAISSGHLAQALLFCGPRGVGKTTCARILAREINGFSLEENPGFNIYELDAASNNSVDDIRGLVEQVRVPPQVGKYKVYIIDEVHMLSNAAFNAFLKTLEEPPAYAIFILATTEKQKILPTILSRCQIYDFHRIRVEDIAGHLVQIAQREGIEAEAQALHLIARKADGALRDALSLFDLISTFSKDRSIRYASTLETLHILDSDYYFRFVDQLAAGDSASALLLLEEVFSKGFDGLQFLSGLADHYRQLLVAAEPKTVELLDVPPDTQQRYLEQSATLGHGYLLNALALATETEFKYRNAPSPRLHVEMGLLKLAHLNEAISLATASLSGVPAEKKK